MQIELPQDQLQQIVAAGIMQMLTPEKREKMIADALNAALTKPTSSYETRTPIQVAFDKAVQAECARVVEDTINKDESFKAKCAETVRLGIEKVLLANQEDIANALAETLGRVLQKRY